jgi:hypothetical protein
LLRMSRTLPRLNDSFREIHIRQRTHRSVDSRGACHLHLRALLN